MKRESVATASGKQLGDQLGEPLSIPVALEVLVRNSRGELLPGTSVQLFRKVKNQYQPMSAVTTDAQGMSRLTLLPADYFLIARAKGYARSSRVLLLSDDTSIQINLFDAQKLKVEVVDEQGPLGGATVLVQSTLNDGPVGESFGDVSREYPHGNATNVEGIAEFFDLQQGPYRVQIFAPGYESYEAETKTDLLVRLRKSSGLRVQVEHQGEFVPGAKVTIAGAQLWPAREVIVDEQGQVFLTGLSAGSYSLYAETENLISPIARNVKVLPGKASKFLTLTLEVGIFLDLSVFNDQGEPLPEADILWSEFGIGFFTRQASTNAEGRGRIGPLQALRGQVAVSARGYMSAYADVVSKGSQKVILQRGGSLVGRVVDEQGMPIAGATVRALGTQMDGTPIYVTYRSRAVQNAHFAAQMGQGRLLPAGELGVLLGPVPPLPLGRITASAGALTTGSDGRFRIEGVAPGKVQVFARHPLFLEGKSAAIELLSGQEKELEVSLRSGQPYAGRVVDERDFPVAQALVRIVAAQFRQSLRTESDGTFRIKAVPPQFRIAISRPQEPLVVALEQLSEGAQPGQEVIFHLPPERKSVELLVTDVQARPIPMARVRFESDSVTEPRSLTRFSDAEGRVMLPSVRGLFGRLQVSAPTFLDWRKESSLRAEQEVKLKPVWVIEGDVRGVRGRLPAAGATVYLEQGKTSLEVKTDEYGHYIAKGLNLGSIWLRVQHREYGKAEGRFLPVAGRISGTAALPLIELTPPWQVSGQVVDNKGQAVPGAWIDEERISAYQGLQGPKRRLGVSDSAGHFSVEVTRGEAAYLFAAKPAQASGFGDRIEFNDRDVITGYQILLDREDRLEPAARGTILVTLEQEGAAIKLFSVSTQLQGDLRQEDELLEVEGEAPENIQEARRLLSGEPGSEVVLLISREGQELTRRIKRQSPAR